MNFKKEFFYKSAHRLLLENSLNILFKKLQDKSLFKKIIDFGSGEPRYTSFFPNANWLYFDKNPSKEQNVFFATEKKIPVENADLFLCIEVIQYIKNEKLIFLIGEIKRIIGKKGIAIITVPYLYPIAHNEYMRMRNPKNYFKKVKNIKYQTFGNVFSILHDALYGKILNLKSNYSRRFLILIILPIKIISYLISKNNYLNLASGYVIIIRN